MVRAPPPRVPRSLIAFEFRFSLWNARSPEFLSTHLFLDVLRPTPLQRRHPRQEIRNTPGDRNPSDSLRRYPAPSAYPGFTRDMRRMFNGAPVVTHEPAQFVEELSG